MPAYNKKSPSIMTGLTRVCHAAGSSIEGRNLENFKRLIKRYINSVVW